MMEQFDFDGQFFSFASEDFEQPGSWFEDPWDWLSEIEDEEIRNEVAQFEELVEDAYVTQEKIRGCSVDMAWIAYQQQRALNLGSTLGGIANSNEEGEKKDAKKHSAVKKRGADGAATEELEAARLRQQRSIFEVKTATSFGPFTQDMEGGSSLFMPGGSSFLSMSPRASSPTAAGSSHGTRPQKTQPFEFSMDHRAEDVETEEKQALQTIQLPSAPVSPQDPASARLGRLRKALLAPPPSNEVEVPETMAGVMAGSPVLALRRKRGRAD